MEKLVEWNTKKGNEAQAQAVEALQRKVRAFRIRVPLIGKFSAGKSTLLNLLLDEAELLEVDILPETALPTEICYSEEDHVYLYPKNSDTPCEISWEQYYNHEYKTSCGQEYQASELQKIHAALDCRSFQILIWWIFRALTPESRITTGSWTAAPWEEAHICWFFP